MRTIIILIFVTYNLAALGQKGEKEKGLETINKQVVQAQLEFLASDWMEGREAGTEGNFLAGDYLASLFKLYGLKPGGEEKLFQPNRYQKLLGAKQESIVTYFQPFTVNEITSSDDHSISVLSESLSKREEKMYQYKIDFNVSLVTNKINLTAPLVFTGYGFKNEKLGYNDFENVDVNGKVIIRISGMPGDKDTNSLAAQKLTGLKLKVSDRVKNEQAMEQGALAVLEYNEREVDGIKWVENSSFRYNEAMYEGDTKPESFYDKRLMLPSDKNILPVISITKQMLNDLIKDSGLDLHHVYAQGIELKTSPKELQNKISIKLDSRKRPLKLRNIIGIVEGENKDKIMVVGAHYDHLGKYNGMVFNGADDNGSGVIAVTTIAKAFMESGVKPKSTVIFALWDGEERGLLGSRSFIEKSESMDRTLLYLNFDMVGRNASPDSPGNKVAMIYTKAYDVLVNTSKKHINNYNLNLDVNYSGVENPVGGSDNSGFAKREIPIFWFHTGGHTDYHKASDHAELINWEKLVDIIKLSYLNMWEFANDPELFK